MGREGMASSLRMDAARNREAIVAAATSLFGECGLEVPNDEIARRAGVGSATLLRRFPRRRDLVVAVFAERLREHVEAIDRALLDPDSWVGFRDYVTYACEMQLRDRGLADLVTMSVAGVPELDRLRRRALAGVTALVRRAKESGSLRADFTPEDLIVILMAHAGLLDRAHGASKTASRRLVHLLLDGCPALAATEGAAPPSRRSIASAMVENAVMSRCD